MNAYRMNHLARKLGLSPSPVGDGRLRDALKSTSFGALSAARAIVRGRLPGAGRWY